MLKNIAENWKSATLNFLFILLFVQVFQFVFGMENSIVGVIFTIMMSASMVRDLTARPLKHLCIQSIIFILMAIVACFVSNVHPILALPVNFFMIFIILYAFTYEYVDQLYFPYILSYLFLLFISPVAPVQMPKRILGMIVGALSIILYQLVKGRKRIAQTACDVLAGMCNSAIQYIEENILPQPDALRKDLCKLSKIVHDRRKKTFCISDASCAMIDTGRGLENLILLLSEQNKTDDTLSQQILMQLQNFHNYITNQTKTLTVPDEKKFEQFPDIFNCLTYIQGNLLKMNSPEARNTYKKTQISLFTRLKAVLNISSVRTTYALRVACLLALATMLVQFLNLPHGKWLLFTIASVSLPYADDIRGKAKKRLLATVIGGVTGVILYALIPSAPIRTIIMMLSGYLSFYFTDYAATFACSTVGALGGAVFLNSFGWGSVGEVLLIRFGYIMAGIIIAFLANCVLFPVKRKNATRRLMEKYKNTTNLLTNLCQCKNSDSQFYYTLVIHTHLQEEQLLRNADQLHWTGAKALLKQYRQAVRTAHRSA